MLRFSLLDSYPTWSSQHPPAIPQVSAPFPFGTSNPTSNQGLHRKYPLTTSPSQPCIPCSSSSTHHPLLRLVKYLNCSVQKRLCIMAYFACIYIPPPFKIAVFGSSAYAYMTLPFFIPCYVPFKDMRSSIR